MTKIELIETIYQKTNIEKKKIKKAINEFIFIARKALARHEKIKMSFSSFGTLVVRPVKGRRIFIPSYRKFIKSKKHFTVRLISGDKRAKNSIMKVLNND